MRLNYQIADRYSQLLEDQSTLVFDVNKGPVAVIELERNATLGIPSNLVDLNPVTVVLFPPTIAETARLTFTSFWEDDDGPIGAVTLARGDEPQIFEFMVDITNSKMAPNPQLTGLTRRGFRGVIDVDDIGAVVEVSTDPADQWTLVNVPDASLFETDEKVIIYNKGFGRIRLLPDVAADYTGKMILQPFEARVFTKLVGGTFSSGAMRKAEIGFPDSGGATV